ncbi:DUF3084 domain-containing protein [Sporomusa malonica]|uniref:Uncharacterized conserved protein, contains DUF3084 domain n=1 Tax=Sporomusa malonica TaxID=112901 RepID=A0A1W1YS07_9FIRM|nr:DUF3084 domain-containing protein [Sporomusa malonica]SMC38892.1 Uncharacterized conserved protein, contains DUF3084 domain [Sporomusa malonica]
MYGLALIAIIAVMGGAIAYIGDKLGTKVGKKKLSIFGLRPKHTSIIVTIVTGILISATTLGVMTAISWDVRTALFGMEELKAELVSLNSEVDVKTNELELSRAALETKTQEYIAINTKVKETAAHLIQIMAELDEVTGERDRAAAALSLLQSDYSLAQRDLAKYQGDIKSLQATKNELDSRIAGLNTKMNELNTAKTALQTDVDRLNELAVSLKKGLQIVREGTVVFRTGEVLSTSVIEGGKSPEDTAKMLGESVYKTNVLILDKLGVADKKLEVLWIARSEFDQAAALIAETNQAVIVRISTVGNTVYGEPVIGRLELFPNHLVYNKGEVVYSEVVNAPRDAQQAEEVVMGFLQKVNTTAVNQGILPDPIQGTVGSMSGAQLFESVNRVKRYSGKIELTAVAKTDTYTAGPLQIEIRIKSGL